MDERTYSHVSVIRESRKWVPLKVDIEAEPEIAARYGLKNPPMVVFVKPDGSVIDRIDLLETDADRGSPWGWIVALMLFLAVGGGALAWWWFRAQTA